MLHHDDRHPTVIAQISPVISKIMSSTQDASDTFIVYFTVAGGEETYGDVKLGCFQSTTVNSISTAVQAVKPPLLRADDPYTIPVNKISFRERTTTGSLKEIQRNTFRISPALDIWSLGGLLYHMMSGAPPPHQSVSNNIENIGDGDFWVRATPRRYNTELRKIFRAMLRVDSA